MENDHVTKAEAAEMKIELLERMDTNRTELLERLEANRGELLERLEAHRIEGLERLEKVETTLLKEFRKWAMIFESRTRVNEMSIAGLYERMGLIEGRVSDLENPST